MLNFRSSRYTRRLALMLIAALYLLPGSIVPVCAASQPVVVKQSMLVFPFDKTPQNVPEDMGESFAGAVKSSLAGASGFSVIAFSERLPSIQRAVTDTTLKKEDCTAPFGSDKEKALKVAACMATDLCLVGSIDECKVDTAKKTAEITITAELADVKTGKTVKMITVTGRAPEGSKAADEAGLIALAAGDAVTKTAAEITPEAKAYTPGQPAQAPQTAYSKPKKKSFFKRAILPILLIVAVGAAAASGGGDDGGSNSGSGDNGGGPPQL